MKAVAVVASLLLVLAASAAAVDMSMVRDQWFEATHAFESGDLVQAERLFANLANILDTMSAPLLNLAVVYEKQGKKKEAKKTFLKARKKFPDDHNVAISTCRYGGNALNSKIYDAMDNKMLISACSAAVKLKPDDLESLSLLGTVYVLLMQFDKAVKTLKTAEVLAEEKSDPVHHQILMNLALANLRGARGAAALEAANKLYRLFPDQATTKGTVAGTRSILIRYDALSVTLYRESITQYIENYSLKDASCPKGQWSMSFSWDDLDPKHGEAKLLNPETANVIYGADAQVKVQGSVELSPLLLEFVERRVYHVKLNDVFMWGPNGIPSTDCVVHACSIGYNVESHNFVEEHRFLTTKTISTPVASTLPLKNTANYYHWMCEGLLRAMVLQDLVLDVVGNEKVKLLIPGNGGGFIRDSLKLLHIDSNRLMEYKPAIRSERWQFLQPLHLVDWVEPKEDPIGSIKDDPWATYYPPRTLLQQLRERLVSALTEFDADLTELPRLVVYVGRDSSSSVRSIANEFEVIEALRRKFGSNLIVHTGREPLKDQLLMFARAAVVVGAHGAGLANTVVSPAGSCVVMLPMAPAVDHTFIHMAVALDLRMEILSDIGSYYYNNYGTLSSNQIDKIVGAATGCWGSATHEGQPGQHDEL